MAEGDKSQERLLEPAAVAAPPEALLVCPECRSPIPPRDFESHLRRIHQIYHFRGVRRSYNDTFVALLDALLVDHPDAEAWRILSVLAIENHGPRADVFLAMTLGQLLKRVPSERLPAVLDSLGTLIGHSRSTGVALTLASEDEILARRLALVVLAKLPQPLDRVLLTPLRGLLLDRRLPLELQFAALAAALRTVGNDGPLTEELLQTLSSGRGKAKSIERLRRFESFAGKNPVIDALCAKLEQRLRMSCPRCGIQLRRRKMMAHLWDEHQLILEGRRVREPWGVIEEWIESARHRQQPELLERCRLLVQRLDAQDGLRQFHRLLLTHGFPDEEARRTLLEEAAEQHAACCPWCYGLVPVPHEVPPLRINVYRGRLSAGGYRVEVSERTLRTFLEIVTPEKILYRGRELRQLWTQRGAMFVFVAPLVLLALVWALGIIPFTFPPLLPVLVILLLALTVHWLTQSLWRPRLPVEVRVRNYAWTMLAPRLNADAYSLADSAFLAGLAPISGADNFEPLRADLLPPLLKGMENALAMGLAPPGHLAALRRLAIEDAVTRGADPVPLLVELLGRCFEGRLSLNFAERLLAGWHTSWWTPANQVRLRILLCERAFEAGFEVRNLLDAGIQSPALSEVLGTHQIANLAALRLLWSLRPTRPWDRCGDSLTVFDLADDPQRAALLVRYQDVLLWQVEPDWPLSAPGVKQPKPAQILFCVRGMVLQDILFTETPRVVEVNAHWRSYDLVLGEHRFHSSVSLDEFALRMERWFRYAFREFLPSLPRVETWQAPDRLAILRAWGAVACPECHRQLLPRVGQIGIALEEGERPT